MNRHKSAAPYPVIAAALLGAGISLAVSIALSAGIAALVEQERLSEGQMEQMTIVVLLLSPGVGTAAAVLKANRQRLVLGAAVGCLYFLTLLLCTAIAFGGTYRGTWQGALGIAGGCGAAILLTPRSMKVKRLKLAKFHYR